MGKILVLSIGMVIVVSIICFAVIFNNIICETSILENASEFIFGKKYKKRLKDLENRVEALESELNKLQKKNIQ